MSFSDPIGDMLTRIRNGQKARKSAVVAPASVLRENVLEVLKQEGYIRGYSRESLSEGIAQIKIELKYSVPMTKKVCTMPTDSADLKWSISNTDKGAPIIAPPPKPIIAMPVAIPRRSGNHLIKVDTGET